MQVAEFTIGRPRDVAWSAQRARLLGSLAGLSAKRRSKLGKAVAHCVQIAVDASATGTIQFGLSELAGRESVVITLNIHHGASGGGSIDPSESQQPFSHGSSLQELLEQVDDLSVEHDGSGTIVRLTQALPREAETIRPSIAGQWSTILATRSTQGALTTTQRNMIQLMENLEVAQTQGLDLQRELENIKRLNETLELLALVASKTENAVIILDAKTCVEWVNDGFVRMTGYELADVEQHSIGKVLYGDEGDSESARDLAAALAARHGLSQDILHHRKDGRTYWASISITPVFSETGTVTRWICIANDVTRRRHAQEELRQAKDAAEAASRAKSEFLANMSHEIRTPMNAIIGMTDLALETQLDDEQGEYLTTVHDSAEALLRLLNDILDLSKIEAGKLAIDATEFSLVEILRDALKAFAFQSRQKGLRLDLQLPVELPERLIGDPVRLRQIVTNLVGNAVKFTHKGGVVLAVKCPKRTIRKANLEFSVDDTGIGIAPDKLEQIFEAFTQADSSTSRRFGGTGLGLTISTQLVELMGGQLTVDSEEGRGSSFRFSLGFDVPSGTPANRQISETGAGAADLCIKEQSPRTAHRGLSVLVADDNRANRQLAIRILQKHGYTVAEAENGRAVIELLRRDAFDVLLLDVQMPEMDGLEATVAIRQMADELPQVPYIIAMTAHAMAGDRERCLATGMDAYIGKPLRARQLLALVEAVATASSASEEVEQAEPKAPPVHDFSASLERLEGDGELLIEQMGYFLEDSPILLRDIRTAIASNDFKRLQMAAHRLRGLSSSFDAEYVVSAATRLENMGREGRMTQDVSSVVEDLVVRWQRLCTAIESYVAQVEFRSRWEHPHGDH